MLKNLASCMAAAVLTALAGCAAMLPATPPTSPGTPVANSSDGLRSPEPLPAASVEPTAPTLMAPDGREPAPVGVAGHQELERGHASWYGPGFHGRRTANGERYDQHAMTAAHKTLPFGTLVRVRSLVTGKEIDVRVNDRGPFVRGRVIDVSRAAAEALGMMGLGVKPVALLVQGNGAQAPKSPRPMAASPRPFWGRSAVPNAQMRR